MAAFRLHNLSNKLTTDTASMAARSPITTHILDTSRGCPAKGVPITLSKMDSGNGSYAVLSKGETNDDGRCPNLLSGTLEPGQYLIRFETAVYHTAIGVESFFPYVEIAFLIKDGSQHYHVPLLLSPFSYSTYRGS
eukprot:m.338719 g.338719  ORF g.338719 m.338719 type:complete len:136 (+) comp18516_c0_seq1:79-486(+)